MIWHCPFFWLAIFFILGILGRLSFWALAISLGIFVLLFLPIFWPCKKPALPLSRWISGRTITTFLAWTSLAWRFFIIKIKPVNLPLLFFIFILGFWRTDLAVSPGPLEILAAKQPQNITLFGRIDDEPTFKDTYFSFPFKTYRISYRNRSYPLKDRLKIISYGADTIKSFKIIPCAVDDIKNINSFPLKPGAYLKISGNLLPPDAPGNPGQRLFYWDNKIKGQAACLMARPEQIAPLRGRNHPEGSILEDSGLIFRTFFNRVRARLMAKIRLIFPADVADLFGSFLLGISVATPSLEVSEAFRKTGLTHLLVVSGFHLSVLGGVILGAARWFGLSGLMTFLTISGANLFLTFLCGGGPSILRATFMNQVTALGNFSGRPRQQLNSFSLAAFLLLLIQPLYLGQPGFQLSFAATGALIFLSPVLAETLAFLPAWLGPTLAMTLSPILLTLPIIAYHFSQLSPISILANLIILPLSEIVLIGGAAATSVSFLWPAAGQILGLVIGIILQSLQQTVFLLSRSPGASFFIPRFTLAAVLIYYLLLYQAMKLFLNKAPDQGLKPGPSGPGTSNRSFYLKRFFRPLPLVIIFCLAFWQLSGSLPAATVLNKTLTVTFLDVGQGDSTLIETPGGQKILVDGGGRLYTDYTKTDQAKQAQDKLSLDRSANQARLALVPALAGKGINKIDLVINSHPDEDHLGGLLEILRQFKVARIWEAPWAKDTLIFKTWEKLIGTKKIPRSFDIRAGQKFILEKDIVLQFFNPTAAAAPPPVRNNPSASPRAPPDPRHSFNDDSLVFTLTYKNFRLLLPGDISAKTEQQILVQGVGSLKSTVLKVAHHGSRYSSSSEFLAAVRPKIAIISVGAHNRFGHPNSDTLDRLKKAGAQILRTDQSGAIEIKTDGQQISLNIYKTDK